VWPKCLFSLVVRKQQILSILTDKSKVALLADYTITANVFDLYQFLLLVQDFYFLFRNVIK
jgi:hypothetical protein